MKIAVSRTGYVGLFSAVLLAQKYEVVALDTGPEMVAMLNRKISPVVDAEIEDSLKHKLPSRCAALDNLETYAGAEFVIIANRITDYICDVADKIYSRDLFGSD